MIGFLRDGRCSIHAAKPRACRLYPFLVEPNESGEHRYLYSTERTHHFKGPFVETRSWMRKFLPRENRDFLQADCAAGRLLASLLRQIPNDRKPLAMLHFYRYKYSEHDLDEPFLEQFRRKQDLLMDILKQLSE